jgi:hypothetical protein
MPRISATSHYRALDNIVTAVRRSTSSGRTAISIRMIKNSVHAEPVEHETHSTQNEATINNSVSHTDTGSLPLAW